jgi:hypothetical protein
MALPCLETGSLAYFDTSAGLVPCKVTAVRARHGWNPSCEVSIVITADRPSYKRGDRFTGTPRQVVPRSAIHRRGFHQRIGLYNIRADGKGD